MREPSGQDDRARPTIVAHCRAGFERECASDLVRLGERAAMTLSLGPISKCAFVTATCAGFDSRRWEAALGSEPTIFARSIFVGSRAHRLPGRDRITPLLAVARELQPPFCALWLETPDTNEGKTTSGFCRRIAPLLESAAREEGIFAQSDLQKPRLHLLFCSTSEVLAGTSRAETGSRWPMGIPRLKMSRAAPSRSALKLAEAIVTFIPDEARARVLKPGMRAVDLGAAPGGWTWQLVERGLRVTAVDNGPLEASVASDPLVVHLRVDGLTYRPRRPVDWMVCDIVDKPSRIAALVASWLAEGACRRTIFNLKLPMKKRYDEVRRCEALIRDALDRGQLRYSLRFKQLYHDREEVTGYCARLG